MGAEFKRQTTVVDDPNVMGPYGSSITHSVRSWDARQAQSIRKPDRNGGAHDGFSAIAVPRERLPRALNLTVKTGWADTPS